MRLLQTVWQYQVLSSAGPCCCSHITIRDVLAYLGYYMLLLCLTSLTLSLLCFASLCFIAHPCKSKTLQSRTALGERHRNARLRHVSGLYSLMGV